jgi:hypothetical protein
MEYIAGHNEVANRSGNQTTLLSFRLQDSNGTYLTNFPVPVNFHITYNNVSYETGDNYTVLTDASGFANLSFNATCADEYYGAPKFGVGEQQWKATLNDSMLSAYYQNDTSNFVQRNVSVWGTFNLTIDDPDQTPTAADYYARGDTISFAAVVKDDCEAPLSSVDILFTAQGPIEGICSDTNMPVPGYYKCDWNSVNATLGWYNATSNASLSNYYNKTEVNYNDTLGGWFYIKTPPDLILANITPRLTGAWSEDHNFTVRVDDNIGDSVNVTLQVQILGGSWEDIANRSCENCSDNVNGYTELNWTDINWSNISRYTCSNYANSWMKFRFTALDEEGYLVITDVLTSGDYVSSDDTFYLEKADVNITHVFGDNETASNVSPVTFILEVNDLDGRGSDFANKAKPLVRFNVTTNQVEYAVVGSGYANETGRANTTFTPDCSFGEGDQDWVGYLDGDSCYNDVSSGVFNISLYLPECTATIEITYRDLPGEVFQRKPFVVNATFKAFTGSITNANGTLGLPSGFEISPSAEQIIGSLNQDQQKNLTWIVNATNYTHTFELNVTVNSTQDYDNVTEALILYKELVKTPESMSLPYNITLGNELVAGFSCPSGDYRTANITTSWDGSEAYARIYVYNGTEWEDVLHSYYLNITETAFIPVGRDQIAPNGTGKCLVKIENVGGGNITINSINFSGYYRSAVKVLDITPKIDNVETNGLVYDLDDFFNATVRVDNSIDTAYTMNVTLNITNSSGDVVNSTVNTSISLTANSTIYVDFEKINSSGWSSGSYEMKAFVDYDSQTITRTENLIVGTPTVTVRSIGYMCNQTTEEISVILYNPFSDTVTYNVTPDVPGTWSVSPTENVTSISSPGNVTIRFNVTSSSSASETVIINITANYTYPVSNRSSAGNRTIENANNIPILEVTRETPSRVAKSKVFESALVAHNKGCGPTQGTTTLIESIQSGWFPTNPLAEGGINYTAQTDPENNKVIWYIYETLAVDEYAVATYQVVSPTTESTKGEFSYNLSWGSRNVFEAPSFQSMTANYTNESHLEFDIDINQLPAYPWSETRSIQSNKTYNHSLKVTNVGDVDTQNNAWNITLTIPSDCNATEVFSSGQYNNTTSQITWQLPDIESRETQYLNFTLNCSEIGKKTMIAEGVRDTRNASLYADTTPISSSQSYTFTNPDQPYEELSNLKMRIKYNFSGKNMTIGDGYVNITDDLGSEHIVWQNYSFENKEAEEWFNYNVSNLQDFSETSHTIKIYNQSVSTFYPLSNVTITAMNYTWGYGNLFEESQNLFTKVKIYDYVPLLENATLYIDGNSSDTVGGWGNKFNFSVLARDRFGRNVTVYVYHKKSTGEYTFVDSWLCEDCASWTMRNFTYDYDENDIDETWQFKFNATSPDGSYELVGNTYEVSKDYVNVDYQSPSWNQSINRSQAVNFTLETLDVDNNTIPNALEFTKAVVMIGENGGNASYKTYYPSPAINSSGHIVYEITNSEWCDTGNSFDLGQNYWKGGLSGSSYYFDNLTQPSPSNALPFMLIGNLYITLVKPNGTVNFTRGSSIQFEATAADDCNQDRTSDSTIKFNISNGNSNYACTADATGKCSIDSTSLPLGWYNLTTASNKTDYNNGSVSNYSLFFLSTVAQLEDPSVAPQAGGWGESPFNFTLNVTDEDNNTVTVYFWLNSSYTSGWELNGTKTCINCNDTILSFERNFTKDEIGTWQYKFNASDTSGFTNQTSTYNVIVEKDNVTVLHSSGNNSIINRSDSKDSHYAHLSVRVNDTDRNNYTTDVSTDDVYFYVENETGFFREETETSNSTHYFINFNASCSYTPGRSQWKVNVTNNTYYQDKESGMLFIDILGDFNNVIITPNGTVNYTQGDSFTIRGNVTDDCANNITGLVGSGTVYFNLTNQRTGTTDTDCSGASVKEEETNGTYNCTWDSSGEDFGWYIITFFTNKSYYNYGNDTVSFYLSTSPSLAAENVSPSSGGWNRTYNYTINVTDYDNDTVTVYFWTNETGVWVQQDNLQCGPCNLTTLTFNRTYTQSYAETTLFFKFNATDANGNNIESSIGSHYIDKDNVSIEIASGNGTEINRSSDSVRLAVRVYDHDASAYTTNVSNISLWLMNDTLIYRETDEEKNDTHYYYDFDPGCNYSVGVQDWKYNITGDAYYNGTESGVYNVTVYGDLNNLIIEPDGEVIDAESIVNITGNISDDCSVGVSGAEVRYILERNGDTYYCPNASGSVKNVSGFNYLCAWNSSGALSGAYNITMNSWKTYYNNGSVENYRFNLTMIPRLEYANVTPRSDGWSVIKNFTINVTDIGDNASVYFWVINSTASEWVFVGNQTCQNCNNQMMSWNYTFNYTDVGTWYFKFNATDTENNNKTTVVANGDYVGNDNTTTVEKDDVELIYFAGNETTSNKTSSTTFVFLINDTDRGEIVDSPLPAASVDFEVTINDNNFIKDGSTTPSNSTGYANHEFYATCVYDPEKQKWRGIIATSDSYYQSSYSSIYNVSLDISCPEFNVTTIYSPSEAFQYNNFGINATLKVVDRNATGVNATLNNTPLWDLSPSQNQYISNITVGVGETVYYNVFWEINATNLTPYDDSYTLNVTANTTAPTSIGYYSDNNITSVRLYKYLSPSIYSGPVDVQASESYDFNFPCPAGDYRLGSLGISWNSTSTSLVRIVGSNYSYWTEIAHSYLVNGTETRIFYILSNQTEANESGYCQFRIENIGTNNVTVNNITFEAYYRPKIDVLDIIPEVLGNETGGLEVGDELFNVTVNVSNPINRSYTVNVSLNITNSSGNSLNYSINTNIAISENSTSESNFLEINTSGWGASRLMLTAEVYYGLYVSEKTEYMIFNTTGIAVKTSAYMCNKTSEDFNITLFNPFYDEIAYNVSVSIPSGWNISNASQAINISPVSSGVLWFNLTSPQTEENGTFNISVNYTYPSSAKGISANYTIENSQSIPILEIVRESPSIISDDRVFESALAIHNRGCGATSGFTELKEIVSPGWTPVNPTLEADFDLNYSIVDLENNVLTWIIEEIPAGRHGIANYQVKSPTAAATSGNFEWNITWNRGIAIEEAPHFITTMNYTNESHLEFDLDVYQRVEFPWQEPRSVQPNYTYNYSLNVRNIGDAPTDSEAWDINLTIPSFCNATEVQQSGGYDSVNNRIAWNLTSIGVRVITKLNFTLNCSDTGKFIFVVNATRDTRNSSAYSDSTMMGCSDSACSQSYVITSPGQPYEMLEGIDFLINYSFSGVNLTVGEVSVNMSDDSRQKLVWQNYTFSSLEGETWWNYTLNRTDKNEFRSNQTAFGMYAHADATQNAFSNLTIKQLFYNWSYGYFFEEEQNLFVKSKVYKYVPMFENNSITQTAGGWGDDWNFSIMVRDRFGRNVTVRLWHRSTSVAGYANYQVIDEYNCTYCSSWTQVNMTFPYNYSHIGDWYYFFNASNPDGENDVSETYYRIGKDNVTVDPIYPTADLVINRSQSVNFTIEVYDTNNGSVPPENTKGRVMLTVYSLGQNETFGATDYWYTNSTGHLVRTMTNALWCADESKYYVGLHTYWGMIVDDSYINDNITYGVNFTLMGNLTNRVYAVNNFSKDPGQNMTFTGNVTDDCYSEKLTTITDADVVFFNLTSGSYSYLCSASVSGENYECGSFDPEGFSSPTGWYNITMFSNKSNHYNRSYLVENAFFLATTPVILNTNVTPYAGGWGESPFNFTTNVTDLDNNTVTLTIFLNDGSGWTQNGSKTCDNCSNITVSFEINFTKYDVSNWQYRINANDTSGFSDTYTSSFIVERDNLTLIHIEGDNSRINRSDSRTGHELNLSVQINDTDVTNFTLDFSSTEVVFYIENETNSWINQSKENTSQYYYVQFNATCSYKPGPRRWQVNVTNSPYYENKSSAIYSIDIFGDLNATLNYENYSHSQGDNITFNGTVTDDCLNNVSDIRVRFKINSTGQTFWCPSETGYVTNATGNFYECEWNSSQAASGYYNVTMFAFNDSYYNSSDSESGMFIVAPVDLEDSNVTPSSGGWGLTYNFTVNVTHYINVTVCLWESHLIVHPTFTLTECKNVTDPVNTQVSFNRTYTCDDLQNLLDPLTWYYKFNATDSLGQAASQTDEDTHSMTRDTLDFVHIQGNESIVNRSGSQTTLFELFVNDTETGIGAPYIGSPKFSPILWFNITNDTVSKYITDGYNVTNSSGYLKYYFEPNVTYEAGKQGWLVYISGDYCYLDGASNIWNVSVWGDLYPNVTWPNGTEEYEMSVFPADNIMNVSGDVLDERLQLYVNATVNFTLRNNASGQGYQCYDVNVTDYSNGSYKCTWDYDSVQFGWYDVIMNATNVSYYNNGSQIKFQAFRIIPYAYSPPDLNNESVVFQSGGGWGENFTFSINVSDIDADNVNVTLWLSSDNLTWDQVQNQTCTACLVPRFMNFSYWNFTQANITQAGQYIYYKFNATDPQNTTDRAGINFTTERDDTQTIYGGYGNNTNVNRTQTLLLRVFINDTDRNDGVLNGTEGEIWITVNGSNFGNGTANTTSNGNLSYNFVPDCNYSVGLQKWFGGAINDSYSKDSNSSNHTFTVYGWLNNSILRPNGSVPAYRYYTNDNVTVDFNIKDDVAGAECGDNITDANVSVRIWHDAFEEYCSPVFNWSSGIYNCTWNISTNPSGWYNITVWSNKSLYNSQTRTRVNAFFHQVNTTLSNEYTDQLSVVWGSDSGKSQITFYVNVTDDDDNVTLYLWESKGSASGPWTLVSSDYCFDCQNEEKSFTRTYQYCPSPNEVGEWYWKINSTDDHGGVVETSVGTFNVTKRDIIFREMNGSDSDVNRTFNNITYFRMNVTDNYTQTALNGYFADFYVTTDGVTFTMINAPEEITTDAQGKFDYNFNPSCDYNVGDQNWRGGITGETCYVDTYSDNYTVTVWSILYNNITRPLNEELITRSDNVYIAGDVRDFEFACGYQNLSTVNFEITGANSYVCSGANVDDLGNGTYNCTWQSAGGSALGLHNITMNSSKAYFYSHSVQIDDGFRLVERPRMTNVSVDNETNGWGHTYNFTVRFRDTQPGNEDNITLWKSYDNITFTEVSTQTRISNTSWKTLEFLTNFTCDDLAQGPVIYYKFNATNMWNKTNQTDVYNITLTKDNLTLDVITSSGWNLARVGSNSRDLIVRAYDWHKGGYPVSSPPANGSYHMTNDSANFYVVNTTATNSSSYLTYTFDPDCNYTANNQYWYASVGDSCYFENTTNVSTSDWEEFTISGLVQL